jgi:hypothetical protein
MVFEDFHTLVVVPSNRILQRSVVELIFEISIDVVIITEELRHDGGVVEGYCIVQCGVGCRVHPSRTYERIMMWIA